MNDSIMKLLKDRYFLSTESSWDDIAKRVSGIYPDIYENIRDMDFIPSTPTLLNANTKGERRGTLSSCFPMGIEDSIEGIFQSLSECAEVTKMGGGVGYDFSELRSSYELVKKLNRYSSGPLPFINIFNSTLDGIQQGGVRRGAGLALLSIYHPNILDFINAKKDITKFTRFNFSLKIDDKFYSDLKGRPDKVHQVKLKEGILIDLKDEEGNNITVKQLWDTIIDRAWATAEPGIFNQSIAEKENSVENVDSRLCGNPCNEYISIPYSSCNLGSINLTKCINSDNEFDWVKFQNIIIKATIFLNKIIDSNVYTIKKIKDITKGIRPIGLGIMGLAHLFYLLRIPYNSKKAEKLTFDIMRFITLNSMKVSISLAKENKPYKYFNYDIFMKANNKFFNNDFNDEKLNNYADIKKIKKDITTYGIYNCYFTSVAPTGSISFISNVSSGIEPVFALSYSRKIEKLDKQYDIAYISDPVFEEYLTNNFDEVTKVKILKQVSENNGSCQKCKEIPDKYRKIFITANDLTPMEHLNILRETCSQTSLSVSKTINLPKDIPKEKISEVYLKAQEYNIKGVTCYRDGSREGILVHNNNEDSIIERGAPKRPKELPCHIYRITVHGEKWIVFVGLFQNHPYEIFSGKVDLVDIPSNIEEGVLIKIKKGLYQFKHNEEILIKDITKLFTSGAEEALTRQISTNLRHGTPIDFIIQQLEKSHGTVVDFNKSILRALKKYLKEGADSGMVCPECGNKLVFFDGCKKCSNLECTVQFCG